MDRTALNLIPAIVQAVAGVVVQRVERKPRQPIQMNSPGLPLTGIHIWRRIFLLVAFGLIPGALTAISAGSIKHW